MHHRFTIILLAGIILSCFALSIVSFSFHQTAVGKASTPLSTTIANQGGSAAGLPITTVTGTTYVYGAKLVATIKGADVTYYYQDQISSNRFTTNSLGRLQAKSSTYPFGKSLDDQSFSGRKPKYTFTGKENDGHLMYFGARYLDPRTGRFTSVDPAQSTFANYDYANDNPMNAIDPDGKATRLFRGDDNFLGPRITAADPDGSRVFSSHILSQQQKSALISVTTDKAAAAKFGKVVEFTAQDIEGEVVSTEQVVQRIKQEIKSGKVSKREGQEAIRLARKNSEVIVAPNRLGNAAINLERAAKAGKVLGVAGIVVGTGISINNIAQAANDGGLPAAAEQTAIEGAGFAGACAGGWCGMTAGGTAGTVAGPWGIAAGSFIGGAVGACVGGMCGEETARGIFKGSEPQQQAYGSPDDPLTNPAQADALQLPEKKP